MYQPYSSEFPSLPPLTPLSSSLKVKVKVQLSLCLTKYHVMKTYWGGGMAPRIL
jgi:hypothetical protein